MRNLHRGVFASHVEEYAAAGLPAFPVDTKAKKPAVRGWQGANPQKARAWARVERFGAADGLGIVMGATSGLTEIDVDGVGEAWVALAIERFGETPVVIRTASGKSKLWYRHNGESRCIRPIPDVPIDVLGQGFTIAPPSWREDLATSYAFVAGGIPVPHELPCIRPGALAGPPSRAAGAVEFGQRNNALWRHCMEQARQCDDLEALVDVALTWGSAFPDPLSSAEMEQCARSAWGYQTLGRNFIGLKKPQVTADDQIMDALIDEPEAYALFRMFGRWHGNRPWFAIAPTAMSAARSPPWPRRRIERGRDVLIQRGFIEEIEAPVPGWSSGRYRLSPSNGRSAKDHYTPSPRPLRSPREA